MNIFLVIHVYPPEMAPAGVNAEELAEDLAKAGHKVTVITGWPNHPRGILYKGWKSCFRASEYTADGYRVLRCGHSIHPRNRILWRMWYYLSFALSTLINGLAAGKADAVLCESTPLFGSLTAWLLAKMKGARSVYKIHDLHPETARNAEILNDGFVYRALRAMDTFVCRKSDVVATLSQAMVDAILARGIDARKVVIARHWLDADKIRPSSRDNAWRKANNIPLDKFVVLHAGTLGYISGAEIIAHAANHLRDRKDILILVVGEGVAKPGLEARAKEYGLDNIRFLPFQLAEVLSDVQATADVSLVTLLPASGDSSIPSKMHGYTAAGRAVIGSVREDTPTARMIREADFGIVTPSEDAAALADAIRYAADHRDEIERMGRNARDFFMRTYERKALTRLTESILIGKPPEDARNI